jgi:hypothetical protein
LPVILAVPAADGAKLAVQLALPVPSPMRLQGEPENDPVAVPTDEKLTVPVGVI